MTNFVMRVKFSTLATTIAELLNQAASAGKWSTTYLHASASGIDEDSTFAFPVTNFTIPKYLRALPLTVAT